MEILIDLEFSDGNFENGFAKNQLKVIVADVQDNIAQLEIQLSPDQKIPHFYQNWKEQYYSLLNTSRGGFKKNQITNISNRDCINYADYLRQELQQWLYPIQIELQQILTGYNYSQIHLVIHTEKIKSSLTKDILHRLPWQEQDLFIKNYTSEVALCFNSCLANTSLPKIISTSNKVRRVKIISIFGDSQNIDTKADKELLKKLKKQAAELIVLNQPNRSQFNALWEEPYDILFFAGHSDTQSHGETGVININRHDSLNLVEIKQTLKTAINNGLKLAIFNSCNGLGLARDLAELHLPYIIVWREVVPDKIAQKFLKYFLSSFAHGKSLFASVNDARCRLLELVDKQDIEQQLPGVTWLPIICQNTNVSPPTWEDLGGLSGQIPDCPYRGLSAFRQEDAPFYFGRQKFISDLLEAVNNKPLVPIIGASGIGKSSLVFAGLIPRLQATGNLKIITFRPGKNPFDALAVVLNKYCQCSLQEMNSRLAELEFEIDLRHNDTLLSELLENIIISSGYQRLVLIADQFEELYTLVNFEERQSFLQSLILAVKHTPAFTLVLTLRADFSQNLLEDKSIGEALNKYTPLFLTPMNREELQDVIEKPALKMKVELEKGLTNRLIDDVEFSPNRLPLLEFALTQLWHKQNNWYLTHKAYENIGGLEKALAKYADEELKNLSSEDRQKAERIFIQLVRLGEGTENTRRVATRIEVGEENWSLVKRLADARLVVTGWNETEKIETVEIVHEALIKEWGTLREWINANREFRIWQERLKQEIYNWENSNRDPKELLQSQRRLTEAEDWYNQRREQLTKSQQNFIVASIIQRNRQERQNRRKIKIIILGLMVGFLFTFLIAGVAIWQWQDAYLNEIQAVTLSSKALLSSEQYFDALIESLDASIKLNKTINYLVFEKYYQKNDIKNKIHEAHDILQEAIYKVNERNRLKGHTDEVTDVSFSPDGKFIATASKDKTVQIWSLDGRKIATLEGHKNLVSSVRFSPIGKIIATASWDGNVKLWTIQGKFITTLVKNTIKINSVRFRHDGEIIATADANGYVKLWNLKGQLIKSIKAHKLPILNINFNPYNNSIATASQDGTVKIWSLNGELLQTLDTSDEDKYWVWSANFSPDGQLIATASQDYKVRIWKLDKTLIKTLDAHKDSVTSVSFSPDGQFIATASADKTVKIWSESGEEIQTLKGHKDWVWSVIFSPDGNMIATASKDGTAKIWQLTGKKHQIYPAHTDAIYSISFNPNSKEFATASKDKTVKIWNYSHKLIKIIKSDSNQTWFTDVNFSPNGEIMTTATNDGKITIWNDQKEKIKTLEGHHKQWIWEVSFTPDGKIIASAGHDGYVEIRHLDNLDDKPIQIPAHKKDQDKDGEGVNSVVFSPDGKIIASAGWDKTIKLWTREGKLIKILRRHNDGVHSVSFSPDGKMIATASEDKTAKLWTFKGEFIRNITKHNAGVFRVRFSPDGKRIATASLDNTVKLSSLEGKEIRTFKGHSDSVWGLNFSPKGHRLASADNSGKLILWDLNLDSNQLLVDGCSWVHDYLQNNYKVNEGDASSQMHKVHRFLCNNVILKK